MKKIYDGFEEGTLKNIWRDSKLEKGSYCISSEVFRKGKNSIKITVREGDKKELGGSGQMTERSELYEDKKYWSIEDKTYTYSFSLYLPKDFPIVPNRLVLAQWKQRDETGTARVNNPLIALRYSSGDFFITLQISDKKSRLYSISKEMRGKWIDLRFKIRFSRNEKGIFWVWINKKKVITYRGVTAYSETYGYPKPGRFYFKMGLYRDTMKVPMTAYFDEYKKEFLSDGHC